MTSHSKGRDEVQAGVTVCDVGGRGCLSVVTSRNVHWQLLYYVLCQDHVCSMTDHFSSPWHDD